MNRCLIRCGGNNLGRASINHKLKFLQHSLSNILLFGKDFTFKDAIQFNTIPWGSWDYQQSSFFRALKYNNFYLMSHSRDLCFLDYVFHRSDIGFAFFLLLLMLLTLKRNVCLCVLSFFYCCC